MGACAKSAGGLPGSPDTAVGARRSTFAEAPQVDASAAIEEALVTREPITVILSDRGWIRAARGRVEDPSGLKFKEGDKLAFLVAGDHHRQASGLRLRRPVFHPGLRQTAVGAWAR